MTHASYQPSIRYPAVVAPRLRTDEAERLASQAEAVGMTVSQLVRRILRQWAA